MKNSSLLIIIVSFILLTPIIGTQIPLGFIQFKSVTGNSMEPYITQSDIIVLTTANIQQLEVGDVIAYNRPFDGDIISVAHRIIDITDQGYKTKGDNLLQEDHYIVSPEDITGVMKLKIPILGLWVQFTKTFTSLFFMLLIPVLFVIVNEVPKGEKKDESDN